MPEIKVVVFTIHHSVWEVAKALEVVDKLNFGQNGFDAGFIVNEIMAPGGACVLLMDGDKVVGYTAATSADFIYNYYSHYRSRDPQDAVYITNSSVHPDYQHKGYIWLMMDALEQELRSKGYKFLDRDSKADLGYADKVVEHYGDRVVFALDEERTEWGVQRYIRVRL